MLTDILKERGKSYGDFQTQANLCQVLTGTVYQHFAKLHPPEQRLPNYMAEAIHMICNKLARIANGDPTHEDSWQDIAGYSQLVVDILQDYEKSEQEPKEGEII